MKKKKGNVNVVFKIIEWEQDLWLNTQINDVVMGFEECVNFTANHVGGFKFKVH